MRLTSRMPDSSRHFLNVFRTPFRRLLPPCAPPALKRGCAATGLAAIPLLVLTIAGTWLPWPARAYGDIRTAAAVTILIAAMCWAIGHAYDANRSMLTRALSDAIRRLPEAERRALLVREVSGR